MAKCKNCQREIPDGSAYCNWCGAKLVKPQKNEIMIPKPRRLKSGNWFIQLRIDGESVPVTEPTEALCSAKARALKSGILKEKEKAKNITLGKAIDDFIESRDKILSPATTKAYKSYRKNRFQNLMDKQISSITDSVLQRAINDELSAKRNISGKNGRVKNVGSVSPKTVCNALGLIRAVLNTHKIETVDIDLPKPVPTNGRTLTPDEIGRLINASKNTVSELPILLAVWIGLRRSEIAALKKSDFNFEEETVFIHSALVQNDKNAWVEKGTKTYKSTRLLSCPSYILDKVKLLDDGLIFSGHPNNMLNGLHRICERNGIPIIRFHDLRHSAASVMLLLNVPDKYAMERGGWTSKQTMTGRYQHTIDTERQAIDTTINNYYIALLKADNANENANATK